MSMLRPAANQLIKPEESIYFLTEGVAKRAKEIVDENVAQTKKEKENKSKESKDVPKEKDSGVANDLEGNPVEMAVNEFHSGKFKLAYGEDLKGFTE